MTKRWATISLCGAFLVAGCSTNTAPHDTAALTQSALVGSSVPPRVEVSIGSPTSGSASRSAAEYVSPAVTAATVVRTIATQTADATATGLTVGAEQARAMAALLNSLPSYASGSPPASGGPPISYVITFVTGGTTQMFTTGDDFGLFAVSVDVDGAAQPMFDRADALVSYLETLFATT